MKAFYKEGRVTTWWGRGGDGTRTMGRLVSPQRVWSQIGPRSWTLEGREAPTFALDVPVIGRMSSVRFLVLSVP